MSAIAAMVACALMCPCMQAQGVCRYPDGQFMTFASNTYAISGTIKNCELNFPCTTTRIPPVADTASIIPPIYSTNTLNSAYQVVYGVTVYDFSGTNNNSSSTDCFDNKGFAEATTGTGSLLQGLVTWTSNDVPFGCTPTSVDINGNVDCNSAEVTRGLVINGVTVPIGSYPAGTAFPVSGTIKDPGCALGTETFNGSVTLQETSVQGVGTDTLTVATTGMHLTGQATCATLGQINVFTTQYDLRVGGDTHKATLDFPYPSIYKMGVGTLQFTAQLAQ